MNFKPLGSANFEGEQRFAHALAKHFGATAGNTHGAGLNHAF
jgi:hypothetical protein